MQRKRVLVALKLFGGKLSLDALFTACGGIPAGIESTILSASQRFSFSGMPSFCQFFVWLRNAFLPFSFSPS
ncbi:hypothetical protein [Snodgrassella alvi]|uniref:hypothetical protein n=1 Tax=Snodgrassella alvi TaxID=1196083 RepID=UPI00351A48C0